MSLAYHTSLIAQYHIQIPEYSFTHSKLGFTQANPFQPIRSFNLADNLTSESTYRLVWA